MKHLLLLLCVLSLLPLNPAQAKGAPKAKKEPIKINAGGSTISAVSATSISVGKGTYTITAKTQILIDSKKADAGALKTGMRASVTPSGIDPNAAMTIMAFSDK